jgi:hypothetical protein
MGVGVDKTGAVLATDTLIPADIISTANAVNVNSA